MTEARAGLELRSTVTGAGELHLELVEIALDDPAPDEVIVRVEAAPLNPSDLGLLLGPADLSMMRGGGSPDRPTLTAPIPPQAMPRWPAVSTSRWRSVTKAPAPSCAPEPRSPT